MFDSSRNRSFNTSVNGPFNMGNGLKKMRVMGPTVSTNASKLYSDERITNNCVFQKHKDKSITNRYLFNTLIFNIKTEEAQKHNIVNGNTIQMINYEMSAMGVVGNNVIKLKDVKKGASMNWYMSLLGVALTPPATNKPRDIAVGDRTNTGIILQGEVPIEDIYGRCVPHIMDEETFTFENLIDPRLSEMVRRVQPGDRIFHLIKAIDMDKEIGDPLDGAPRKITYDISRMSKTTDSVHRVRENITRNHWEVVTVILPIGQLPPYHLHSGTGTEGTYIYAGYILEASRSDEVNEWKNMQDISRVANVHSMDMLQVYMDIPRMAMRDKYDLV